MMIAMNRVGSTLLIVALVAAVSGCRPQDIARRMAPPEAQPPPGAIVGHWTATGGAGNQRMTVNLSLNPDRTFKYETILHAAEMPMGELGHYTYDAETLTLRTSASSIDGTVVPSAVTTEQYEYTFREGRLVLSQRGRERMALNPAGGQTTPPAAR